MEFKGTPAPWYLQISGEDIEVVAGNLRVASLNDTNDPFFNGDLITAAPELLEALRELIQTHEYSLKIGHERIIELGGDCDSPEIMINNDSSLNKAKAAIAKALGQQ